MLTSDHFHPMLVHFPIALIIVGFLAESASLIFKKEKWLKETSYYCLIIGACAAVVGYLSGEFFTGEITGAAGELKETHELWAKIAMYTMLANSAFRIILHYLKSENPLLMKISFAVYFISALSVGISGYFGGSLVYDYMIP